MKDWGSTRNVVQVVDHLPTIHKVLFCDWVQFLALKNNNDNNNNKLHGRSIISWWPVFASFIEYLYVFILKNTLLKSISDCIKSSIKRTSLTGQGSHLTLQLGEMSSMVLLHRRVNIAKYHIVCL
jgi:hypothetical protein